MRNYLLFLRYDGTNFHGWQRQEEERTVQGELERGLAAVLGGGFRLKSSSRTDAGVHAVEHPVNVWSDAVLPPAGLAAALNSALAPDVSVQRCLLVPAEFNAKKMALGKTYRYRLFESSVPDPFLARTSWRLNRTVDEDAMRDAAACLLGEHDFSAFRAADCDSVTTRRLLSCLVVERRGREVVLTVSGNAFLRNMVRILVGSLAEVGLGRRDGPWLAHVLASRDRTLAGPTAPAHGLFLLSVSYPPEVLCDGAGGW